MIGPLSVRRWRWRRMSIPARPQHLCKEALVLRPCLCSADSTGPSHTALDRLSRATHPHTYTHPGPQAGSRTIFMLAYKAGQQPCFVHACLCVFQPLLPQCRCGVTFSRRIKVCIVSAHDRDGGSLVMEGSKCGPVRTARARPYLRTFD